MKRERWQDEDEPPIAPRARTEPAWSLHERSIDETRCREKLGRTLKGTLTEIQPARYIDQLPERLSNWTPPPETSQARKTIESASAFQVNVSKLRICSYAH